MFLGLSFYFNSVFHVSIQCVHSVVEMWETTTYVKKIIQNFFLLKYAFCVKQIIITWEIFNIGKLYFAKIPNGTFTQVNAL